MATTWCIICGEGHIATEATEVVDGDPMCAAHAAFVNKGAEMLAAAAPSRDLSLCSRGCGKPTHRGSCPGRVVQPEVEERCKRGCGKLKHAGSCPGENRGFAGRNYTPGPRQAIAELPKAVENVLAKAPRIDVARCVSAACNAAPKRRGLMDTLVSEVVRDDEIPEQATTPKMLGRLGEIWKALETLESGCSLRVQNRDRSHLTYTRLHLQKGARLRSKQLRVRVVGTDLFVRYLREDEAGA